MVTTILCMSFKATTQTFPSILNRKRFLRAALKLFLSPHKFHLPFFPLLKNYCKCTANHDQLLFLTAKKAKSLSRKPTSTPFSALLKAFSCIPSL